MKTYWTAPGKGATVSELLRLLLRTSRAAYLAQAYDHLHELSIKAGLLHRLNLAIGNGDFESYDVTRIESVE